MAGLDASGFSIRQFDEIKRGLEEALRRVFGTQFSQTNLDSTSLLGQFVGVEAKQEYDLWLAAAALYKAGSIHSAEGRALDGLAEIPNLQRKLEAYSKGVLYLVGTAGSTVPAGTSFSTADDQSVTTDADAVLSAGVQSVIEFSASAAAPFNEIIIRFDPSEANDPQTALFRTWPELAVPQADGNDKDFTVQVAGATENQIRSAFTSFFGDGVTGVSVTGAGAARKVTVTTDENFPFPLRGLIGAASSIKVMGRPNGAAVAATSALPGPIGFPAGSIVNIDSPVSGLNSVVNLSDFIRGRLRETDAEFRARLFKRQREGSEKNSRGAIQSALENLPGVTQAQVFEGAASFEAVVDGGEDDDIAAAILAAKTPGISTFGDRSVQATDENGLPEIIKFSRTQAQDVYVRVTFSSDPEAFPPGGEEAIRQAIVSFGEGLSSGAEVRGSPDLIWAVRGIPGITSLDVVVSRDGRQYFNSVSSLQARERPRIRSENIEISAQN